MSLSVSTWACKRNAWGSSNQLSYSVTVPLFSQLEVMRTSLTGTGTLGWGSWYGAETQHSCVKLEGILQSQLEFVGSGHGEAGLLQ